MWWFSGQSFTNLLVPWRFLTWSKLGIVVSLLPPFSLFFSYAFSLHPASDQPCIPSFLRVFTHFIKGLKRLSRTEQKRFLRRYPCPWLGHDVITHDLWVTHFEATRGLRRWGAWGRTFRIVTGTGLGGSKGPPSKGRLQASALSGSLNAPAFFKESFNPLKGILTKMSFESF